MPDGDVIKRRVQFAWRSAYEGLSAGGADADVPGLVARSVTASLRRRGMPPVTDAASLVGDVWNGRVSESEGLGRVAATVGSVGGTRDSALLEVAVRRAIIAGPTGARPDQAVVESYLNALVDAELMAKTRPALLEGGQLEPVAVEETITRWTAEIQEPIQRIAQQLVANPGGEGLRAPPSRRADPKNTAAMLDETV